MINFNDLQVVESKESERKAHRIEVRKNYIIGFDPFDTDIRPNYNRFCVFDRFLMRKVLRITTKSNFDWFINFIQKRDEFKGNYVISYKFITDDGRIKTIEQIRIETGGFKEYIDPQ